MTSDQECREKYLDAIRDLADELGRTPTVAEMSDQGEFHAKTITRALRSTWNEAVAEAGLVPNESCVDGPVGGAKSQFGLEDLDPSDVGLSPMEGGSP